jgi:DUF2939 family protein
MAKRGAIYAGIGCAIALVLALAAVGGLAGYFYWTSPRYSLRQVKNAAERRDIATFEKYVDIRGVCDSAVDRFLEQSQRSDKPARSDGDRLGRMLGAGLARLVKPTLVDTLQSEIRRGVAEGRVADGERKPHVKIEEVDRSGATANAWLRMPGEAFDPPRERDVRLRIRLRDMGHYWQVYEVIALEGLSDDD